MKFKSRFERKVWIADYVTESYEIEVEFEFEVSSKREHTLACLTTSAIAEEAVFYKLLTRDFITKELYALRLKAMMKEVEVVFGLVDKDNLDTRLKVLVEGFINR